MSDETAGFPTESLDADGGVLVARVAAVSLFVVGLVLFGSGFVEGAYLTAFGSGYLGCLGTRRFR